MAKTAEYIERKQKAALAPLEKAKWWQQTYDPRPPQKGDLIKARGKDLGFIAIASLNGEEKEEFVRDLGYTDSLQQYNSMYRVNLQPGFTYRVREDKKIAFVSDVFISAQNVFPPADRTRQDIPEFIQISAETANRWLAGRMYGDQVQVLARLFDLDFLERVDPIDSGPTNYETLQEIIEQLDKPGMAEIYNEVAEHFRAGMLTAEDVDDLLKYAPLLEWKRKYGADPLEDFRLTREEPLTAQLSRYNYRVSTFGINLENNQIEWNNDTEWSRGDFRIIELSEEEDYLRQGNLLDQCIRDTDEHPYYDMALAKAWVNYSLLNKSGRPVATICAARAADKHLVVLENRGRANTSMALDAAREGRSGKYAQIIDTWLKEWSHQGYVIDRESENCYYAPQHPEYGMEALGYEFNENGELYHPADAQGWPVEPNDDPTDGRAEVYEIEDLEGLEQYRFALLSTPHHFVNSEAVPDREYETNYYNAASQIYIHDSYLDAILAELIKQGEAPLEGSDPTVRNLATLYLLLQHNDVLQKMAGLKTYDYWKPYVLEKLTELSESVAEGDDRERARAVLATATKIFEMPNKAAEHLPGRHSHIRRADQIVIESYYWAMSTLLEPTKPVLRDLSAAQSLPLTTLDEPAAEEHNVPGP